MANPSNPDTDIAALRADLSALRRDMSGLIDHMRTDAARNARTIAGTVQDSAGQVYRDLADKGETTALAVGRQVEAQPVIALLVALGIGYVGGRVLSK